jgi:hypothetical protein
MAVSLKMSAARRYILHSGSREVPNLCANKMVAIRPMDSWSTESSSAAVGEAEASPTPTPVLSVSNCVRRSDAGEEFWREWDAESINILARSLMLRPAVRVAAECVLNAEYNLIGTLKHKRDIGCTVPSSTAREARRPAIDDEKAWRESYGRSSGLNLLSHGTEYTNIDLISAGTLLAIRVY